MAADRLRFGFALMVAVVFIAIFAVMATIVAIALSGDNDQARIEFVADALHRLSSELDSVSTTSANFRGDLPQYPLLLSDLTHRPAGGITKICTGITTFNATNANAWRGPYHTVPISPSGHYIAAGFFVNNTIQYVGGTDGSFVMDNVALNDANRLDVLVDGTSNLNAGIIRYSSTSPTSGQLTYHKVVSGC